MANGKRASRAKRAVETAPSSASRGKGRPSLFDDEKRRERIIDAVRVGNYLKVAAAQGGVSYKTFREWMNRGEREREGQYRDFRDDVKKAEAEAEAVAVGEVRMAGRKNWTAYAWWLERKFPKRWGKQTITHEGDPKAPIVHRIEVVYADADDADRAAPPAPGAAAGEDAGKAV